MPVTADGVLAAFVYLEIAGKTKPRSWADDILPTVIATWVADLPDIDDAELLEAVRDYGRTGTGFWPALSDVLDRVHRLGSSAASGLAWSRLVHHAERWGYSLGRPSRVLDTPAEHDAAVCALEAIGGWGRLCSATRFDLTSMQREFAREFRREIVEGREAAARPMLTGGSAPRQIEDGR